jgi:hypothetical protein
MKSNVFICKWKKTASGWRLWVRGKPKVSGTGPTFEEAVDELVSSIQDAADDLDAVLPVLTEFDPPPPPSAVAEPFLKPELYTVHGDEIFDLVPPSALHLRWKTPPECYTDPASRARFFESCYSEGICSACGQGRGKRTDLPLFVDHVSRWVDGGWIRGPIANLTHVFSDRFLSLLTPGELRRFEFRAIELPSKAGKQKYFELLAGKTVPFVGVKGFDASGWECKVCGHRFWSVDEWALHGSLGVHQHFVCRSDLPRPLPSCFPVGDDNRVRLCVTRRRWDELRGHQCAHGIASQPVGVVDEDRCDRSPRLPQGYRPCKRCRRWVEGACVYRVPGRPGYWAPGIPVGIAKLRWVASAVRRGALKIVRRTVSLGEMEELVATGARPRASEVISFRCPQCWRLGRIIIEQDRALFHW